MQFTMTVNMDNAAFRDDDMEGHGELAEALDEVRHSVVGMATEGKIRDGNGATVGEWSITGEPLTDDEEE